MNPRSQARLSAILDSVSEAEAEVWVSKTQPNLKTIHRTGRVVAVGLDPPVAPQRCGLNSAVPGDDDSVPRAARGPYPPVLQACAHCVRAGAILAVEVPSHVKASTRRTGETRDRPAGPTYVGWPKGRVFALLAKQFSKMSEKI